MAIFTMIAGAIAGALFGGSMLATTLIAGALAFGAKLLLSSYLGRKKQRQYSGYQAETQYGGDVPASTLYGIGCTKGHRVYYAKFGSGNKYNAEVFRLANGWCDGLEPYIYFYGAKQNLVAKPVIGNEAARYWVEGYDDLLEIRFYDGRPGQKADAKLVTDTAALGLNWKATSVGEGICYAVVYYTYSQDKFSNVRPQIDFVLRGLRQYDFRKDSSVAGGSGPQRIGNPATWAATQNPAVQRMNYQLGLQGSVSGRTIIGEGKSLGQLDLGTYAVAMNVCDTLRNGKPTYQSSLFVNSDDDHTEVLKEFDDAMAGYGLNRRGLSGIIAGAPQIPVMTITDADIPQDRAREIKTRKSSFAQINHLSGQYTCVDKMWQPESLTPIYVNADVAKDRKKRQASNDFLQVIDPDIAQYLLTIRYRQNRKGGAATLPVSRRVGLDVQEGEWVNWDGKTWLITGWGVDQQFRCTLNLAETGADIYAGAIAPGPIVIPSTPPVNPSLLSTIQNFNVEVGVLAGANGEEVPSLRFTWTPPADPTITQVRFFYTAGTDDSGIICEDVCTTPEAGAFVTSKDVRSGVHYTARAIITTVPSRFVMYTMWVTTATVTPTASIYPVGLGQIADDFKAMLAWRGEADRDIRDNIEDLNAYLSDVAFGSVTVAQEIKREMTATFEDVTASWEEKINIAVGPNSAIGLKVETLSTEITGKVDSVLFEAWQSKVTQQGDDLTSLASITSGIQSALTGYDGPSALANAFSSVTTEVSNIGGVVNSQSNRVDSLFASLGGNTTEALFKMSAVAGPAGYARIGGYVKSAAGAVERNAGFAIDLPNDTNQPSRFVAYAQQFIVMDPSNAATMATPFMVDANGVYINAAVIRKLTASQVEVTGRFNANTILQNGTLITDLIAAEATSSISSVSGDTLTVANPNGYRVVVFASARVAVTKAGGSANPEQAVTGSASANVAMPVGNSGALVIAQASALGQYANTQYASGMRAYAHNSPGAGNITVSISSSGGNPAPTVSEQTIVVILLKR